jgi:zinc transporter ZupT
MPDLWVPFSAGLLAALATTIGIYMIRHFEAWGRRNSTYFSCFAAGVLIAVSFRGILAAMGMVVHEFPKGIISYLLLISGGGPKQSLVLAFLTAAVSTPLGTLVSYPMISRIEPSLLGALLSVSGGALIYVGGDALASSCGEGASQVQSRRACRRGPGGSSSARKVRPLFTS